MRNLFFQHWIDPNRTSISLCKNLRGVSRLLVSSSKCRIEPRKLFAEESLSDALKLHPTSAEPLHNLESLRVLFKR